MIEFETARHRAMRLKAGGVQNAPAPAAAVATSRNSNSSRLGYGIQISNAKTIQRRNIQIGNAKTVQRRTAQGNVMEVTLMPVPMRKTVRQIMGGRKRQNKSGGMRRKKRRRFPNNRR